ncbi:isochorismatase family protein [Paenactinomyces guangxiensis]|uniref:Isochorismatase family protein n=1 Tax=Paenactinomyces guangxiensis TaxID=1490290 RepID=A0A7W1WNT9_9BACL|nr:isochorismatase family protein [Paenactinomyces guangxiensis]MBA4493198.1 isochorismatase family protein [Paenactinomyces guangxiensis]MBH8589952.1 isochorismatase family protein [Paenactinomyces guangxiensis]
MKTSSAFISYMSSQLANAPQESITSIVQKAGDISNVYLVFVDILKGFCETGALSSERVNEMVEPVARFANQCLDEGLPNENLIFLNDNHPADAVEFEVFAPHCIRGTAEAQVVGPLQAIQQRQGVQTFFKNATNGLFGRNENGLRFFEWLEQIFDKGTSVFIVVGDCTDLCIYQNAMAIRLLANEKNIHTRVIVPQSLVRTYDLSVEQANQLGALAHDADLMDLVFLYHMKMNGVEIISSFYKE